MLLRTTKSRTPPAHMHSICTTSFVASASWNTTPSNTNPVDAVAPEIFTVASLKFPPKLPPRNCVSCALLIHNVFAVGRTTRTPRTAAPPSSTVNAPV